MSDPWGWVGKHPLQFEDLGPRIQAKGAVQCASAILGLLWRSGCWRCMS